MYGNNPIQYEFIKKYNKNSGYDRCPTLDYNYAMVENIYFLNINYEYIIIS